VSGRDKSPRPDDILTRRPDGIAIRLLFHRQTLAAVGKMTIGGTVSGRDESPRPDDILTRRPDGIAIQLLFHRQTLAAVGKMTIGGHDGRGI